MFSISKQLTCQKYIYKIHSSRLRKAKWKLTLPLSEARRNDEMISIADSQVLRWIDQLNGLTDADGRAREIKEEIRQLRKQPTGQQTRQRIRELYEDAKALIPSAQLIVVFTKPPVDFGPVLGYEILRKISFSEELDRITVSEEGSGTGILCQRNNA